MVNGKMERSMDLGDIHLLIKIFIRDNSLRVIDLEKENILGQMEVFTMDNGSEIK
jgi:hypothetical protein